MPAWAAVGRLPELDRDLRPQQPSSRGAGRLGRLPSPAVGGHPAPPGSTASEWPWGQEPRKPGAEGVADGPVNTPRRPDRPPPTAHPMNRAAPRPPPPALADVVVGNQVGAVPDNSFTIFVVDTELGTDSTISGYSDTSV